MKKRRRDEKEEVERNEEREKDYGEGRISTVTGTAWRDKCSG